MDDMKNIVSHENVAGDIQQRRDKLCDGINEQTDSLTSILLASKQNKCKKVDGTQNSGRGRFKKMRKYKPAEHPKDSKNQHCGTVPAEIIRIMRATDSMHFK